MTISRGTLPVEFHAPDRLLAREPVAWAADRLRAAVRESPLHGRGLSVELFCAAEADPRPDGIPAAPDTRESYRMRMRGDDRTVRVCVAASDERGVSYALTELAERVSAGDAFDALGVGEEEEQRPAAAVRGIQRAFSGLHEDSPWFHDRNFWDEYLDFLAAQRFNRFHLALGMQYNYGAGFSGSNASDNYLCFAYPFLVDVPGFAVRAQNVDEAERNRNLESLAHIALETRRRGLEFQLGLWNHAYDYALGARHTHPILGIGPESHVDYCAAALGTLLRAVPDIDGLTFRVHYEGGVHERIRETFWERMFQAVSDAGRPMRVDLHAKGLDAKLATALRKPNIRPSMSLKYWAEHMGLPYHQASIRGFELMRLTREQLGPERADLMGTTELGRRFTRYGYADYLDEDRGLGTIFRLWSGTQKLLLWGDPAFARGYGRQASFGGSLGLEFQEPLFFKGRKGSGRPGGRDPYVADDLRLGQSDWHKYRYTYLLWGRLSYDPDAPPETWRRFLRREYGKAAADVEALLAPLSRILPLVTVAHAPSAACNAYWPEVYHDLPVSPWVRSRHYAFDTAARDWLGVSSLDPQLFYSVRQYVEDALAGQLRGKYTPLEVAAWIERFVCDGELVMERAREDLASGGPQARRVLADAEVLIRLGRFFAGKFRSAVEYALYLTTGAREHIDSAVNLLAEAHAAYAGIVDVSAGVYRDELAFGDVLSEHGHWSRNLDAMADDLHALRVERDRADTAAPRPTRVRAAAVPRETRPLLGGVHLKVPERFRRGTPLIVELVGGREALDRVAAVTLHFRHVDQSEAWEEMAMRREIDAFTAQLPADFTSTSFPVMCYAEAHLVDQAPVLIPGFEPDLANQPYVVIHSTAWKAHHPGAECSTVPQRSLG